VSCADPVGRLHGQIFERAVISFTAHHTMARGLTEPDAELGSRHRPHHDFIEVLHGLDEVALSENDVAASGISSVSIFSSMSSLLLKGCPFVQPPYIIIMSVRNRVEPWKKLLARFRLERGGMIS